MNVLSLVDAKFAFSSFTLKWFHPNNAVNCSNGLSNSPAFFISSIVFNSSVVSAFPWILLIKAGIYFETSPAYSTKSLESLNMPSISDLDESHNDLQLLIKFLKKSDLNNL